MMYFRLAFVPHPRHLSPGLGQGKPRYELALALVAVSCIPKTPEVEGNSILCGTACLDPHPAGSVARDPYPTAAN